MCGGGARKGHPRGHLLGVAGVEPEAGVQILPEGWRCPMGIVAGVPTHTHTNTPLCPLAPFLCGKSVRFVLPLEHRVVPFPFGFS